MRRWTGVSGGFSPRSSAAAAWRSVNPVPVSTSPMSGGTSPPQTPVSQSVTPPRLPRAAEQALDPLPEDREDEGEALDRRGGRGRAGGGRHRRGRRRSGRP